MELEAARKELAELQTDSKSMMERFKEKERQWEARAKTMEEETEKWQNKTKFTEMQLQETRSTLTQRDGKIADLEGALENMKADHAKRLSELERTLAMSNDDSSVQLDKLRQEITHLEQELKRETIERQKEKERLEEEARTKVRLEKEKAA